MDNPHKKHDFMVEKDPVTLQDPLLKERKTAIEIERLSRLIFTPTEKAIAEINHRRTDPALRKKISDYLQGDVPEYFNQPTPVFYLQRFIATPNYELLHCAELAQSFELPLITGQDHKSKFSTNNELKVPLGKLPVIKGLSHNANTSDAGRSIRE